jgi:hypothetical protein
VNTVEDRMRDAFAGVTIPDVPVPAIQSLQRRARRHRLNQAGGALGSAAVVVICIFGGMSFSGGHGAGTVATAAVQRIPAHIQGGGSRQWLVSSQQVDGTTYSTSTFLTDGKPCTISTDGEGTCDTTWPAGQVAALPDNLNTTYRGEQQIVEVTGRVPLAARTVEVHMDDAVTTVRAVETPTTSKERFFSAYLSVPANFVASSPIIGVFDANGAAVAAPHPQTRVIVVKKPLVSHLAGLPSNQRSLPQFDALSQGVVYRNGDTPCVALAAHSGPTVHVCAPTRPQAGRPLLSVRIPGDGTIVVGDAPSWTGAMQIDTGQGPTDVTLFKMPGYDDRVFWMSQISGSAGRTIATCTDGDNCRVVERYLSPSSAG